MRPSKTYRKTGNATDGCPECGRHGCHYDCTERGLIDKYPFIPYVMLFALVMTTVVLVFYVLPRVV